MRWLIPRNPSDEVRAVVACGVWVLIVALFFVGLVWVLAVLILHA